MSVVLSTNRQSCVAATQRLLRMSESELVSYLFGYLQDRLALLRRGSETLSVAPATLDTLASLLRTLTHLQQLNMYHKAVSQVEREKRISVKALTKVLGVVRKYVTSVSVTLAAFGAEVSVSGPRDVVVDISMFSSMRALEVIVDDESFLPSGTNYHVGGLRPLQRTMERIMLKKFMPVPALAYLLTSFLEAPTAAATGERKAHVEHQEWNELQFLSVRYGKLTSIDDSIRLAPKLELIDLSYNQIEAIENLHQCIHLKHVNLGHNRIGSLLNVHVNIGNLTSLVLRNNRISDVSPLRKCFSLESLDLSHNDIDDYLCLYDALKRMPFLSRIWLMSNPISKAETYRVAVLVCCRESLSNNTHANAEFYLDDILATKAEVHTANVADADSTIAHASRLMLRGFELRGSDADLYSSSSGVRLDSSSGLLASSPAEGGGGDGPAQWAEGAPPKVSAQGGMSRADRHARRTRRVVDIEGPAPVLSKQQQQSVVMADSDASSAHNSSFSPASSSFSSSAGNSYSSSSISSSGRFVDEDAAAEAVRLETKAREDRLGVSAFQEQVRSLRKEASSHWLTHLNALHSANYPAHMKQQQLGGSPSSPSYSSYSAVAARAESKVTSPQQQQQQRLPAAAVSVRSSVKPKATAAAPVTPSAPAPAVRVAPTPVRRTTQHNNQSRKRSLECNATEMPPPEAHTHTQPHTHAQAVVTAPPTPEQGTRVLADAKADPDTPPRQTQPQTPQRQYTMQNNDGTPKKSPSHTHSHTHTYKTQHVASSSSSSSFSSSVPASPAKKNTHTRTQAHKTPAVLAVRALLLEQEAGSSESESSSPSPTLLPASSSFSSLPSLTTTSSMPPPATATKQGSTTTTATATSASITTSSTSGGSCGDDSPRGVVSPRPASTSIDSSSSSAVGFPINDSFDVDVDASPDGYGASMNEMDLVVRRWFHHSASGDSHADTSNSSNRILNVTKDKLVELDARYCTPVAAASNMHVVRVVSSPAAPTAAAAAAEVGADADADAPIVLTLECAADAKSSGGGSHLVTLRYVLVRPDEYDECVELLQGVLDVHRREGGQLRVFAEAETTGRQRLSSASDLLGRPTVTRAAARSRNSSLASRQAQQDVSASSPLGSSPSSSSSTSAHLASLSLTEDGFTATSSPTASVLVVPSLANPSDAKRSGIASGSISGDRERRRSGGECSIADPFLYNFYQLLHDLSASGRDGDEGILSDVLQKSDEFAARQAFMAARKTQHTQDVYVCHFRCEMVVLGPSKGALCDREQAAAVRGVSLKLDAVPYALLADNQHGNTRLPVFVVLTDKGLRVVQDLRRARDTSVTEQPLLELCAHDLLDCRRLVFGYHMMYFQLGFETACACKTHVFTVGDRMRCGKMINLLQRRHHERSQGVEPLSVDPASVTDPRVLTIVDDYQIVLQMLRQQVLLGDERQKVQLYQLCIHAVSSGSESKAALATDLGSVIASNDTFLSPSKGDGDGDGAASPSPSPQTPTTSRSWGIRSITNNRITQGLKGLIKRTPSQADQKRKELDNRVVETLAHAPGLYQRTVLVTSDWAFLLAERFNLPHRFVVVAGKRKTHYQGITTQHVSATSGMTGLTVLFEDGDNWQLVLPTRAAVNALRAALSR